MYSARPAIAADPRRFGRGMARTCAVAAPQPTIGDDMRLFATTFAVGFLFVTVFLA